MEEDSTNHTDSTPNLAEITNSHIEPSNRHLDMAKDILTSIATNFDMLESFQNITVNRPSFNTNVENLAIDLFNKVVTEVSENLPSRHGLYKPLLILSVAANNLDNVKELLMKGLNPNIRIRRDRYLVHIIKSSKMLDLLVEYGLDLSINQPLNHVPFDAFTRMIVRYNINPWVDMNPILGKGWRAKGKYLNRRNMRRHKKLKRSLDKIRILPDLRQIIHAYILPSGRFAQ